MSAKRFIYCEEENGEFPFPYIKYDGKKVISLYECVDLLNQLAEENGQLKSKFECEFAHRTEMAHHRLIEKDLKKENEQLKKELENNIASYKKCNRRVFDLIDKKIKEVDTIGVEVLKDLRRELME